MAPLRWLLHATQVAVVVGRLERICLLRYCRCTTQDAQQEISACMRAWACMADPRARRARQRISTAHAPSARAEVAGLPISHKQGAQESGCRCRQVLCGLPVSDLPPPACALWYLMSVTQIRVMSTELMNERNSLKISPTQTKSHSTVLLGAPHKKTVQQHQHKQHKHSPDSLSPLPCGFSCV
jgi:hypothetical protein